jgi:hypothetical protein
MKEDDYEFELNINLNEGPTHLWMRTENHTLFHQYRNDNGELITETIDTTGFKFKEEIK